MNNAEFYNSFYFMKISFQRVHQYDCTQTGCPRNYIGVLIRGTARLTDGAHTLVLSPGEAFFIPYRCRYRSFWQPDADGQVAWYSFGFDLLPLPDTQMPVLQVLPRSGQAGECLERLCAEPVVNCRTVGLLYGYFGGIAAGLVYASHTEPLVERTCAFFRDHPTASVGTAARTAGVSVAGLYAAFGRAGNETPGAVRQRLLCEKATDLLVGTDQSVEEISNRLGFSSSAYFRKVFREHKHCSPREYRKRYQL